MDTGILMTMLTQIQQSFSPGLGAMRTVVLGLTGFLVSLEVTRIGVNLALGSRYVQIDLVRIFMRLGVFLWLYNDWPHVVNLVRDSFVELGLRTGGNTLTVPQFLDPGNWWQQGLTAGQILWTALGKHLSIDPRSWVLALAYLGAWLVFTLSFAAMGIGIFILQVELSIAVLGAFVLLAFIVLQGTRWLANGAVAYPINCGFRFCIKAITASAVFPLTRTITATNPDLQQATIMCGAAVTMALVMWKAPAIASGILSGLPVLTAGQAIQTTAGAVIMAGAGAGVSVAASGLGMRLAKAGGRMASTRSLAPLRTVKPSVKQLGQSMMHTAGQSSRHMGRDSGSGGVHGPF